MGVLSKEGKCKVFDVDSDGYVRSETSGVLFLQKIKEARRNYARVVYTKANSDGFTAQSIHFPSKEAQTMLLEDFYQECQVNPASLSYYEAHGTGTVAGDPEECAAVDEICCKNRKEPLLIGSVKSNLGHSENTSGFVSVSKVRELEQT